MQRDYIYVYTRTAWWMSFAFFNFAVDTRMHKGYWHSPSWSTRTLYPVSKHLSIHVIDTRQFIVAFSCIHSIRRFLEYVGRVLRAMTRVTSLIWRNRLNELPSGNFTSVSSVGISDLFLDSYSLRIYVIGAKSIE